MNPKVDFSILNKTFWMLAKKFQTMGMAVQ